MSKMGRAENLVFILRPIRPHYLHTMVCANTLIRRDLQIPSVKEEISHYSSHYSARLTVHPNDILLTLLEQPERKRQRRHLPNDLPTRFMV
jgi:hypothetical protein